MSFQEQAYEGAAPRREASPWAVGFTVFAGTMMIMLGLFDIFQGLAAVLEDSFFVLERAYAFDMSLDTWGWLHIVIGIIVMLAGFYVFSGTLWARLVGIVLAVIAAVTNFFYIPYYPVWSLLIIAVSIGVIWALATHGRETEVL
jgi:hypothetical protein